MHTAIPLCIAFRTKSCSFWESGKKMSCNSHLPCFILYRSSQLFAASSAWQSSAAHPSGHTAPTMLYITVVWCRSSSGVQLIIDRWKKAHLVPTRCSGSYHFHASVHHWYRHLVDRDHHHTHFLWEGITHSIRQTSIGKVRVWELILFSASCQ